MEGTRYFRHCGETGRLGDFWPGSSKEKALVSLLSQTLEHRSHGFEKLLLGIVREGLTYRRRTNPVTKSEILQLNELLKRVGFKFPDLWDPVFLDSLAEKRKPAQDVVPTKLPPNTIEFRRKLEALRSRYYALALELDRNAAGIAFQTFFHDLLDLFDLQPKPAFRLTGEEIDGDFLLDNETYLLEAKWEAARMSEAPLLVFREKIAARSHVTRGVFVAVNGYTEPCLDAITRRKQPNFFLIDGYDIAQVVEGRIDLPRLLREKLRMLAATGEDKQPRDTGSFGRDGLWLVAKLADRAHTFIFEWLAELRAEA